MAKKKQSDSTNNHREEACKRTAGEDLRIEYIFPEDQRAIFSNYATVQREGLDFHLSFFEIRPPLILGSEKERKEQLGKLKSVQAHSVARIVISAKRAEGLIHALSDQLSKLRKDAEFEEKTSAPEKKTARDLRQDSKKK